MENNLIEKNEGTIGGAIWTGYHFCNAKFINNTIVKNKATLKGGAINSFGSDLIIMNSILWQNSAPNGSEIFIESGTINVSYSDVDGGWTGTGNMNVNPKLISNYCLLNHNSLCIDAGNPDPTYNDPEIPQRPGYARLPSRGTIRNDMGAYGGPGANDWWYDFLDKTSFDEEELVSSAPISSEIKIENYPNPFNPSTIINFSIPQAAIVSLQVFDILGNEIQNLVNESKEPGVYRVEFNGSGLASGMYLYRIQVTPLSGSGQTYVETKKMLLLK